MVVREAIVGSVLAVWRDRPRDALVCAGRCLFLEVLLADQGMLRALALSVLTSLPGERCVELQIAHPSVGAIHEDILVLRFRYHHRSARQRDGKTMHCDCHTIPNRVMNKIREMQKVRGR